MGCSRLILKWFQFLPFPLSSVSNISSNISKLGLYSLPSTWSRPPIRLVWTIAAVVFASVLPLGIYCHASESDILSLRRDGAWPQLKILQWFLIALETSSLLLTLACEASSDLTSACLPSSYALSSVQLCPISLNGRHFLVSCCCLFGSHCLDKRSSPS